ncbi:predicted esterase [Hahella chejuensis KCTC 2396]|uniref:Predicted esterase n=1 Tax=Hahella chejuensis (strain KCTC 2396) TaxID=349521 RepID=Q2S9N3_HAHCH|nr:YqiA/YcfP family alpha/beta fold hydrolase [Hahella chejuensis]ABC32641.1 predicted esterase [Hahella chejuensis KCTC 2396]
MSHSYILYLHGFNSSPQSFKAQCSQQWLAKYYPNMDLAIPALHYSPAVAMERLEREYFAGGDRPLGVIGSSLGGYYAAYLHHRYGVSSALINPAVRPYDLLEDYLGINKNLYTGEEYVLEPRHMDELLALDSPSPTIGERIYTLVQTGDATLNYREAALKFAHCALWVQSGGSHEFEDFERVLPSIVNFFLSSTIQK